MLSARTMSLLIIVLLCGAISSQARAECAQADAILNQAYPDAVPVEQGNLKSDGKDISVSACKVWSAHPALTLALVTLMAPSTADGNLGDLDVLLLDSKSLKPSYRLHLPGYMDDDAIHIDDLSLDTAYYRLAPGIVAFGIRKELSGSSRPDPFGEVDLSLYAIIGGKLRTVLNGLAVSSDHGDWDTQCTGTFSNQSAVLSMSKASTNGFADIDVRGAKEDREDFGNSQQCQTKSDKHSSFSAHLHYDGHKYAVPKDLAALQ